MLLLLYPKVVTVVYTGSGYMQICTIVKMDLAKLYNVYWLYA